MRRNFLFPLVLALMTAAGCDDSTGSAGPGSVSLLLTDEPGDFQEAWVTIESVELAGGADGAVVLRDEPFSTDLLTLSNDVATLVDQAVVPAGVYTQLRFVISEGCIVVEGAGEASEVYASNGYVGLPGEEDAACDAPDGALQMPSFDQSGLKVNLPGGSLRVEGEQKILLVDFDVSQSFGRLAGNSGQWVMHPVVRAEDVSLSGSIAVSLALAEGVSLAGLGPIPEGGTDPRDATLGDFEAVLTFGPDADMDGEPDGMETLVFTDDDQDGVYTAVFLFVLPDAYDVSVALGEGVTFDFTLDPEAPQTIELGSGQDAEVSFAVTSAAAPAL
ncbi:MAG: DUF4382 domain-containing protein [Longimicrobiales bacterium]|nr:DUF4382 domain-containing protein [Longimicrobiales bacterium]